MIGGGLILLHSDGVGKLSICEPGHPFIAKNPDR